MSKFFISMVFVFASSFIFALNNDEMAPNFSLEGSPNATKLSEHKGKYVVLEWYNDGCPFVRKHYDSKNMQGLQKKYKGRVSWLTINSSAEGRQGYLNGKKAAASQYTKEQMAALNLLLDSDGKVGKAYGAKTTPHMYIIDPKGKLVYQGAIDSISSADSDDIRKATNYVDVALSAALAGRKIATAKTQPYGCSVKY